MLYCLCGIDANDLAKHRSNVGRYTRARAYNSGPNRPRVLLWNVALELATYERQASKGLQHRRPTLLRWPDNRCGIVNSILR